MHSLHDLQLQARAAAASRSARAAAIVLERAAECVRAAARPKHCSAGPRACAAAGGGDCCGRHGKRVRPTRRRAFSESPLCAGHTRPGRCTCGYTRVTQPRRGGTDVRFCERHGASCRGTVIIL
eukprot:7059016-Prymnesium_polylepis.1